MAAALSQLEAPAKTPAVRERKPDVVTPPSWNNRQGDARIEGTLAEVDCSSDPVRLLVSSTAEAIIELMVRNPTGVELLNANGASTTLVCGAQSLPVAVEYLGASREVTRIEFRDVVIMKR